MGTYIAKSPFPKVEPRIYSVDEGTPLPYIVTITKPADREDLASSEAHWSDVVRICHRKIQDLKNESDDRIARTRFWNWIARRRITRELELAAMPLKELRDQAYELTLKLREQIEASIPEYEPEPEPEERIEIAPGLFEVVNPRFAGQTVLVGAEDAANKNEQRSNRPVGEVVAEMLEKAKVSSK